MNDMNVIRKTSSGIQSLSLDAVLLDKRMIFLSGVITSASVDLIVKQLLFLEGLDEIDYQFFRWRSRSGTVSLSADKGHGCSD